MTMTASRITTAPMYAVLPAENLERARAFYHDTLGFEVTDMLADHQFIAHSGKGTSFLVYERPRTKADHTVATFIVDDLETSMSDLRAHGVTFLEYDMPGMKTVNGVVEMNSGKGAWFEDPEGNIISVVQM